MSTGHTISTIEDFFAHALAIEREAAARYRELAGQMHAHHNGACAALFDWLAQLESQHTARLQAQAAQRVVSEIEPAGCENPCSAKKPPTDPDGDRSTMVGLFGSTVSR